MRDYLKFYIDGRWVDPVRPNPFDVENPATEQVSGKISLGSADDVDVAVRAARRAFTELVAEHSRTAPGPVAGHPRRIQKRAADLAEAVTEEIGAPRGWPRGGTSFRDWASDHRYRRAKELRVLRTKRGNPDRQGADRCLRFDHTVELADQPGRGQGLSGVGDRLTVILKPSEVAPYSPYIFAEILDAAGVPAGVFNLVNGDGAGRWRRAGQPSRHRHGVVHWIDPRRC